MSSRIIPLEDLKQRSVMFWLPPGGRYNNVWADTWIILAELERAHAAPVLMLLQEAGVGAYIANPSGRRASPHAPVQLYVDREQHNKAVDVMMQFLRGKGPQAPAVKPSAPKKTTAARPAALRAVVFASKAALLAGIFAVLMVWAYYEGPRVFPTVQHGQHPPAVNAPGMPHPQP